MQPCKKQDRIIFTTWKVRTMARPKNLSHSELASRVNYFITSQKNGTDERRACIKSKKKLKPCNKVIYMVLR
jgi:hypothetical protein